MNTVQFTPQGYKAMQEELETLKEKRKSVVQDLRKYREMGDLSENGAYKGAKFQLGSVDSRMRMLTRLLKESTVTLNKKTSGVSFGNTIQITDGTRIRELTIVGEFETNPLEGKISEKSALGSALLSKYVGDSVMVAAPMGKLTYTILKIY